MDHGKAYGDSVRFRCTYPNHYCELRLDDLSDTIVSLEITGPDSTLFLYFSKESLEARLRYGWLRIDSNTIATGDVIPQNFGPNSPIVCDYYSGDSSYRSEVLEIARLQINSALAWLTWLSGSEQFDFAMKIDQDFGFLAR